MAMREIDWVLRPYRAAILRIGTLRDITRVTISALRFTRSMMSCIQPAPEFFKKNICSTRPHEQLTTILVFFLSLGALHFDPVALAGLVRRVFSLGDDAFKTACAAFRQQLLAILKRL